MADLPFTVRSEGPTVVEVRGKDGKTYEVRLQVVVLGVGDTGAVDSSGLPSFQMSVQVATHTLVRAS